MAAEPKGKHWQQIEKGMRAELLGTGVRQPGEAMVTMSAATPSNYYNAAGVGR